MTIETDKMPLQIRVRISTEEKAALDKLRVDRGNDENISDLVREALAMLRDRHEGKVNTALEKKLLDLATLLQREPGQVKNACLEGIFDLIENKARTPLIVMESQLYSSYSKS